jgi:hypothetical protein
MTAAALNLLASRHSQEPLSCLPGISDLNHRHEQGIAIVQIEPPATTIHSMLGQDAFEVAKRGWRS